MQNTWLLADPHFSHKNILKHEPIRPFHDLDEMDDTLITNYNTTVGDGDLVFWLGDMFFGNAERTAYILGNLRLDGKRNILIRGNHDRQTDSWFRKRGFDPHKMYYHEGLMLTHHPMHPQNLARLYENLPYFIGNAHGHTHSADTGLDPEKWQCLSVENTQYAPISYTETLDRFSDAVVSKFIHSQLADTPKQYTEDYFKTGDHLRL